MKPAALLLLGLVACAPSAAAPGPSGPPPTPVRVVAIERANRARPVHATGVLASKSELRASFKVGGLVRELAVDEGDTVRAGQVLARLTTTEVDASVEQARQGLDKAERDLGRTQRLFEGQAVTRQQLDDATTAAAVARAQMRAAAFNRAHAVIRAPGPGRVLRRLAEPGEMVAPGQPVLVLSGDRAGWIVRVGLADRDVVRVARGDRATLALAAYPGVTLAGSVDEIASAATPPIGTYEVELRVELPAGGPEPLSGLVGRATIEPTRGTAGGAPPEVAFVPAAALRDGDGTTAAVWVPDPACGAAGAAGTAGAAGPPGTAATAGACKAIRRAVTIAYFDGDRVAIATGLEGAAAVITDGAAYLTPTSTISITPAAEVAP